MTTQSIQALENRHVFSEKPGRKLVSFLIFCFVLLQYDEYIICVHELVVENQNFAWVVNNEWRIKKRKRIKNIINFLGAYI